MNTKLQKAGGVLLILMILGFGIGAVALQPDTITSLEQTLSQSKETYLSALETCRSTEQSLAQAKLEIKGAAKLPVDQIEKLQKKAKGEGLEVCPLK
jgi:hypothetical protein